MLDRFERPLRILCLGLGALLLFQLARVAFRKNPLDQLSIPALPTLATNVTAQSGGKGTNAASAKGMEQKKSNAALVQQAAEKETDAVSVHSNTAAGQKNTNTVIGSGDQTNTTSRKESNSIAQAKVESRETNTAKNTETKGTNVVSLPKSLPKGMGSFPGMSGGKKPIDLPPAIQARVEKITQSEILAQVVRPLPMALLGIAGNNAFLRAPSGQSGVVKEGEEVGGIKLLKIGTNRVLIEQEGEKKELMVFSGFGGESLLPKEKEQKETPK